MDGGDSDSCWGANPPPRQTDHRYHDSTGHRGQETFSRDSNRYNINRGKQSFLVPLTIASSTSAASEQRPSHHGQYRHDGWVQEKTTTEGAPRGEDDQHQLHRPYQHQQRQHQQRQHELAQHQQRQHQGKQHQQSQPQLTIHQQSDHQQVQHQQSQHQQVQHQQSQHQLTLHKQSQHQQVQHQQSQHQQVQHQQSQHQQVQHQQSQHQQVQHQQSQHQLSLHHQSQHQQVQYPYTQHQLTIHQQSQQQYTHPQHTHNQQTRHQQSQDHTINLQRSQNTRSITSGTLAIGTVTSVPTDSLQCSEYCHEISVDYKRRNKKDDAITREIIKTVTAYMNTSGGVLTVTGSHTVGDLELHEWRRTLCETFRNTYTHYSDFVIIEDDKNTAQKLHIIAKPSPDLVTVSYQMYTREDGNNMPVIDNASARNIIRQTSKPGEQFDPTNMIYNSVVTRRESRNIEYKCWKIKNDQDIIRLLHSDRTQKSLLAMPNLPTGGYVIIGIEENAIKQELLIMGQKVNDEAMVEKAIEDLLTNDPKTDVPRIWASEDTKLTRGTHWDVSYPTVKNCPENENRVLIVIQFGHCPGGVFIEQPEAYQVTTVGEIRNISFDAWKTNVLNVPRDLLQPEDTKCEPNPSSTYPPDDPDFCSTAFETNLSPMYHRSETTNERKRTCTPPSANSSPKRKKTTIDGDMQSDHDLDEYLQLPSTSLKPTPEMNKSDKVLSTAISVSWCDNNKNWKDDLEYDKIDLKNVLVSIENILQCSHPLRFIPDEDTILGSVPAYRTEIINCIEHIKHHHAKHKGVIIASKEWIKLISDFSVPIPANHIIDFICIDDRCFLRIISVFGKNDENNNQLGFVRCIARRTKRHIVLHKSFTIGRSKSLYIEAAVWDTDTVVDMPNFLNEVCMEHLSAQPDQWKNIQTTMGMLLLNRDTSIRRNIGDECLIKLTMDQMGVLLGTDISRLNLIEGPPGSGKTLLALYVTRLFGPHNCHILCQNPSLKAYLEFQQEPTKTSVVTNDKDFLSVIRRDEIWNDLKCLVIDDGHTFDCKIEIWKELFQMIWQRNIHLFIFMDNKIQNFRSTSCTAVQEKFCQFCIEEAIPFQTKTLNKVHRNTQKIVSYINAGSKLSVKCGHQEEGDDVEIRRVHNLYSPESVNGLLALLKEVISADRSLTTIRRYDKTDIAVLVDGQDHQSNIYLFLYVFSKYLPEANVHQSHQFPVQGVVVDHVDKFSGLDAKVCILVSPGVDSSTEENGDRNFMNAKYNAFVASRGIHRVIFVTELPIHSAQVKGLNFDPTDGTVISRTRSPPNYKSARLSLTYNGRPDEEFDPHNVAVCKTTGHVVVTDPSHHRIHILTSDLRNVTTFGEMGQSEDVYDGPWGVAISSKRLVYLACSNNQIKVTDLHGREERVLEMRETLAWEGGLAMDSEDRLYVCVEYCKVLVLTTEGVHVTHIRPQVNAEEGLHDITVTEDRVAVCDDNCDVHIFTTQGEHKHTLSLLDTEYSDPPVPGRLGKAEGLTYDSHGSLLVADSAGDCIHVFSSRDEDETVCVVTESSLIYPRDVCVTADGDILVCGINPDTNKGRLVLFSVRKLQHSTD